MLLLFGRCWTKAEPECIAAYPRTSAVANKCSQILLSFFTSVISGLFLITVLESLEATVAFHSFFCIPLCCNPIILKIQSRAHFLVAWMHKTSDRACFWSQINESASAVAHSGCCPFQLATDTRSTQLHLQTNNQMVIDTCHKQQPFELQPAHPHQFGRLHQLHDNCCVLRS